MLFFCSLCPVIIHTRWKMADFIAFLFIVFSCIFVTFRLGVSGQVWYLIEPIPGLCIPLLSILRGTLYPRLSPLVLIGTGWANSVESDLRFTSRIYYNYVALTSPHRDADITETIPMQLQVRVQQSKQLQHSWCLCVCVCVFYIDKISL